MSDDLIKIIGSIVSGLIGYILGYIISRRKDKDDFSIALFQEYRTVANELETILKDLLSLSFVSSNYSDSQLNKIAEELSAFYFKNYLILPQTVLEEIQCLYTCLHHKGRRMFKTGKDELGNIVQRQLTKEEEQKYLMKDSSIMLRADEDVLRRFYKKYPDRLPDTFLKFQARHLLTVMHDCWNIKNIHEWKKRLSKDTIAQRERKQQWKKWLKYNHWKSIFSKKHKK